MSGCIFSGADFRDADLWNADLKDSDLSNSLNLLPAQLSATDLTRAKLTASLESFEPLDSVEELSQNSANVFLTMLGAVVYTFLTIATTKDTQLITNSSSTRLPLIGVEIPIIGFFIVAPLLLVALFIYFHIYLMRLWEAVSELPAIFPNGRRLDEKTYPWLLNDLVRQYFPRLRKSRPPLSIVQAFLSIALGYWLVPITLAVIWLYFLRLQDWTIIGFHLLCIAVAAACSSYCTRLVALTLGGKDACRSVAARINLGIGIWRGVPAGLLVLLVIFGCSFAILEWDTHSDYTFPAGSRELTWNKHTKATWKMLGKNLRDAFSFLGINSAPVVEDSDVSARPANWTGLSASLPGEIALIKPAKFNKGFRRLDARHAFLVRAQFGCPAKYTNLVVTILWSDFRCSDFEQASFWYAPFDYCDFRASDFSFAEFAYPMLLREANLTRIELDEQSGGSPIDHCDFSNARFDNANLIKLYATSSSFRKSSFVEAKCAGIRFLYWDLDRADFTKADPRWARFRHDSLVDLNGNRLGPQRIQFVSANCSNATFENYDLTEANFISARLDAATFNDVDLTNADFDGASLQGTDLSGATGLEQNQLLKAKTLYHTKLKANLLQKLKTEVETPPPKEEINRPASE